MDATQWGVPDPRRDSLKHTFEEAADSYDAARPRYPQPLFDDLAELGRLRSDASLLEIGCGTGIATLPMAQRGFSILALEVGPKLASKAAEKLATFPEVDVITAPFETWEPEAHDFDLVYAATSWHWLDPEIRYDKAASLLKDGGSLAIFGATHAFPADADPFFFEIQEIYEALDESHPGEQWPPPRPEDIPDHSQEILSSGRFEDVTVRRYVWHSDYTAEQYIALLDTFSGHIAMEREKRDFLYAEIRKRISRRLDRKVRRHWLAILHVAPRS
jgi:SAM-dependent methyltransferase